MIHAPQCQILMTARQPKSDGASGLTRGSTADWPGMPENLKSTGPSAVVTGAAAAVVRDGNIRTILNRVTNDFATAVSRVLLGGK